LKNIGGAAKNNSSISSRFRSASGCRFVPTAPYARYALCLMQI